VDVRLRKLAPAALVVLAACSPKELTNESATPIITEHPEFAAPATQLGLAGDIIDSLTGFDGGVVEGIWKYTGGRDAQGKPNRTLTKRGQQHFKDTQGTLLAPAPREVVQIITISEKSKKERTVLFTWKYKVSPAVAHFTGRESPAQGEADLVADGRQWKVAALRLNDRPGSFVWTAPTTKQARDLLSQEQEAVTTRMLAVENQRFKTAEGQAYELKISDAEVAVDVGDGRSSTRRTIPYVDLVDCKVETAGGLAVLRFDGVRGGAQISLAEKMAETLQKACDTAKEARKTWAQHNPDVADRGPLGTTYSR
jgi:hypothetical protein